MFRPLAAGRGLETHAFERAIQSCATTLKVRRWTKCK